MPLLLLKSSGTINSRGSDSNTTVIVTGAVNRGTVSPAELIVRILCVDKKLIQHVEKLQEY